MLKSTVFLIMYLQQSYQTSVSELRKITSSDCICPDDDQIYECTVVGDFGGITVWRGTAFSDCEINLLHSQYVSREGAFGNCNGRAIRGRSLRIENDRYVSQLSVTPTELSSGINGDTIECNYDDGSVVHTIGNYSISLTKAPLPPIGDIIWTATDSLLTFDWSVSAASDCPDIQYNILASNCGSCPTTTNHTNVTCTNVPTKDTCTFAIWRVVCGNVTEKTNNTVCIMLPLQERIDDIINFNKNDTLTVSEVTTLTGYQGAVAAVGFISVLLMMCIITLSLLLFKAKQELKNRETSTSIQGSNLSPILTTIDTKKNIAYEHVITQNTQIM